NDKQLTVDLCTGTREKLEKGIPLSYKDTYERCWDHNPSYRPKISDILNDLDNILKDLDNNKTIPPYPGESDTLLSDVDKEVTTNNSFDKIQDEDAAFQIQFSKNITKAVEQSISFSTFLPLFRKLDKLFCDVRKSYKNIQLNKGICQLLYQCIISAEGKVKTLSESMSSLNFPIHVEKFKVENVYNEIEETTKFVRAIQCNFKDVYSMFEVIEKVKIRLNKNSHYDEFFAQSTFLKKLEDLVNITSFYGTVKVETFPSSIYLATEWSEYGNLK
ncbi:8036_t:CDS:2, partial [Gigaspora rosea]